MRRLCRLKGMDQAGLAARLGVSRSTVSRILSGVQEPKLGLARALADALGVGLDGGIAGPDDGGAGRCEVLSREEVAVLCIVRRIGVEAALDRLLAMPGAVDPPAPGDVAVAEVPRGG